MNAHGSTERGAQRLRGMLLRLNADTLDFWYAERGRVREGALAACESCAKISECLAYLKAPDATRPLFCAQLPLFERFGENKEGYQNEALLFAFRSCLSRDVLGLSADVLGKDLPDADSPWVYSGAAKRDRLFGLKIVLGDKTLVNVVGAGGAFRIGNLRELEGALRDRVFACTDPEILDS